MAVGEAAPNVDEMSVDDIVASLLNDPHASAMLASISRPAIGGASAGSGTPGRNATAATAAAAPPPQSLRAAQPVSAASQAVASASARGKARLGVKAVASAPAAAFPPRVDIDSLLNRLHGKRKAANDCGADS